MQVTSQQGLDWRDWLLLTSIPLVQVGEDGRPLAFGSGTMIDHEGRRFLVTAEHVVKLDSKGWAIVVQQHADGRLEYYMPRAFVHVGEGGDPMHPSACSICVLRKSLRTWKPGTKLALRVAFLIRGHITSLMLRNSWPLIQSKSTVSLGGSVQRCILLRFSRQR
jgi:hypothetical protein